MGMSALLRGSTVLLMGNCVDEGTALLLEQGWVTCISKFGILGCKCNV